MSADSIIAYFEHKFAEQKEVKLCDDDIRFHTLAAKKIGGSYEYFLANYHSPNNTFNVTT